MPGGAAGFGRTDSGMDGNAGGVGAPGAVTVLAASCSSVSGSDGFGELATLSPSGRWSEHDVRDERPLLPVDPARGPTLAAVSIVATS